MASGSQTKSGIWALLPVAPTNRHSVTKPAKVIPSTYVALHPMGSAAMAPKTSVKLSVPNSATSANIPIRNAKSPMRLTMNALRPA